MVGFCMMIGLGAAQPTNNEQNIEMNLLGIEFMVVWPTVFALGRWHRADVGIEIPAAADLQYQRQRPKKARDCSD